MSSSDIGATSLLHPLPPRTCTKLGLADLSKHLLWSLDPVDFLRRFPLPSLFYSDRFYYYYYRNKGTKKFFSDSKKGWRKALRPEQTDSSLLTSSSSQDGGGRRCHPQKTPPAAGRALPRLNHPPPRSPRRACSPLLSRPQRPQPPPRAPRPPRRAR